MRTTDRYILVGHDPVPAPNLLEWADWFETADRKVADDAVSNVRVSTVFLALDHQWKEGEPPLLFETLVFGGPLDGETDRYATWTEAEAGHARMLARVIAAKKRRKDEDGFR